MALIWFHFDSLGQRQANRHTRTLTHIPSLALGYKRDDWLALVVFRDLKLASACVWTGIHILAAIANTSFIVFIFWFLDYGYPVSGNTTFLFYFVLIKIVLFSFYSTCLLFGHILFVLWKSKEASDCVVSLKCLVHKSCELCWLKVVGIGKRMKNNEMRNIW